MNPTPSHPLTVLQTLPALESGGVERGTLEVARALVAAGHRSLVLSAGGRLVAQLEQEGSEHITWPIGRKSLFTLRRARPLRRLLEREGVDILHARSRMPAWVAWLAWRGMDPAHRPRFVTTVHGLYSVNAYSAVMTRGERIIAVSQTIRDYILDNYPGVDPARIELIYRGVDPAEFPHGYRPPAQWLAEWQGRFPQLAGRRVLTLPGRITRLKGHEDFIRLIGRLTADGLPVHGLIVGGAEAKKRRYLEELRASVAAQGLDAHITFTGQRGDLREIMAVSDLVLSLSTQPESFGRTVLEALSLGVPVVGYNHGGVGEVLGRLYPAGLVPVGDAQALRHSVPACLDRPQSINPNTEFTLDRMLRREIETYQELATHDPMPDLR